MIIHVQIAFKPVQEFMGLLSQIFFILLFLNLKNKILRYTWSTVKYSQKLWLSPTENIKAQQTVWWELKFQHTKQGLNNAKCVGIGSTRLNKHIETTQKFHSKVTGEEYTMHLLQILQFRMWHMWVKQSCRFINVWIIMRDIICKPKLTYHFGLSHECRSYTKT
jgi:hypothetical protein